MKRFRANTAKDMGYSLIEILVAITLFVIVAAITGAVIVQANQATRRASAAAITQSQLLDVVSRMTREVAIADPITFASPTKLETLSLRDGNNVRTQFEYVGGEILSRTSTALAPGIPAQLDAA